jgi:hypothetical protein
MFSTVLAWANAHPEVMAALVWPLVTAILTLAFKPRTPEQYAAMPPRLAALLQLVAALGVDPVKAAKAVRKLVEKGPPPAAGALLLVGGLALSSTGCTAFQRAVVADLLTEKIACAVANMNLPNERIIEVCAIQPGDVQKILQIVGESRKQAAKAAADASARASAGRCEDVK